LRVASEARADTKRGFAWLIPTARFVRFVIVGIVNTALGYLAFLAALAVCPSTLAALVASTILAVSFNFVTQGLFVFRSFAFRRFARFWLIYGLVFAYNAAGLFLLERWGVAPQIGGLLLLPGAVLMSYGLNSRFVFVTPRRGGRSGLTQATTRIALRPKSRQDHRASSSSMRGG
jgi:putative flippase GtrA